MWTSGSDSELTTNSIIFSSLRASPPENRSMALFVNKYISFSLIPHRFYHPIGQFQWIVIVQRFKHIYWQRDSNGTNHSNDGFRWWHSQWVSLFRFQQLQAAILLWFAKPVNFINKRIGLAWERKKRLDLAFSITSRTSCSRRNSTQRVNGFSRLIGYYPFQCCFAHPKEFPEYEGCDVTRSIIDRRMALCFCPIYWSNVCGRMRSTSGAILSLFLVSWRKRNENVVFTNYKI